MKTPISSSSLIVALLWTAILATNAQGPAPLWVASNSGVPLPPADTLPNAAFVDDPAVLSDKRLDSPGNTFFEGAGVVLTLPAQFQS
jgi:hypothetical protein